MKHRIAVCLLFFLQLYFVFKGISTFGKYLNPVLLLVVTLAIAVVYFIVYVLRKEGDERISHSGIPSNWRNGIIAIIALLFCAIPFHNALLKYSNPSDFSDVLPQLETLYQRFTRGEFPYAPVQMTGYAPFPVYMPLHWLPIGISELFKMDVRWTGFILLIIAIGVWGFFQAKKGFGLGVLLSACLPAFVLLAYLYWGGIDLPVSFETVVAAYYLVLATGLFTRNIFIITAGLILCLLSRYTLLFWLPVFSLLMLQTFSLKKNFFLWSSVSVAILGIYVIPFLSKDISIFLKGIEYHNHAAVDEWKGYGNPAVSYSFETGIYFAQHFKKIFSGSMEQRVFYTRAIQGTVMLLLNVAGIWFFQKWKTRIHVFEFLFVQLYLVLACFYFFGPLTYRYYLITLLIFSAVMAGRVLVNGSVNKGDGGTSPT